MFEARRLRVQLPSGEKLVFEGARDESVGDGELAADEAIIKGICIDFSFEEISCLDFFTTALLIVPASLDVHDSEGLSSLRERLEARLEQVAAAEQARGDRG